MVVGSIYAGLATPTEAAAVAVVYGIFVGLFIYKELKFKDFPQIIFQAVLGTTMIMLLVGAANVFGWLLTNLQIPHEIGQFVVSITDSPIMSAVRSLTPSAISISGYCREKSGNAGIRRRSAKDRGASIRKRPEGFRPAPLIAPSASSRSARRPAMRS